MQQLKMFKVTAEDSDGLKTQLDIESLSEETLRNEFIDLGYGKLIDFVEIDPTTRKPISKNFKEPEVKISKSNNMSNLKLNEDSWKEVTLQSGQTIRVSSTGKVQEQTWKDLTPETLYSDTKVRILKNGKSVSEFPKNYTFQKLVWIDQENNC